MSLSLFDIPHPFGVIAEPVDAQAENFTIALIKFRLKPRHIAKFGGANWCKILGVRK